MRESRTFAERTKVLKSDETIKKYFLIYEGTNTEMIYFDAVRSLREEIGINPLIELVPVIRSFSEEKWSNPKKILDRIIQNLDESAKRTMTYESLMNRIMDYFYDTEIIAMSKVMAYNVCKTMQEVCKENLEKSLDDIVEDVEDACGVFVEYLEKKYQLENVISDISEIIENGGITYDKTLDKICLIVDRDKDSFVSGQYKYVVDKCKECGFMLCVSNPCFEFWLLLHFDEVLSLDKDKLLNNPKMNAKRRYAEYSLKIVYPGYRKSSYCAERFVKNIDIAIENEKKFCEDINELEHTVGSNIGVLIEEMRRH